MWWSWVAAVGLLLVPGGAWARARLPELSGALGGSLAVLGAPNDGGASVALSALWPVTPRFSFGIRVHGDDAGSLVDSLRDAQGRGLAGGKVDQLHRAVWGVSWCADLRLPDGFGSRRASALRWLPFASQPHVGGTWGFYRVADDVRGRRISDVESPGFSLAAGWRYAVGERFRLGPVIRYHRLFNERTSRFMSVGLEGAWR